MVARKRERVTEKQRQILDGVELLIDAYRHLAATEPEAVIGLKTCEFPDVREIVAVLEAMVDLDGRG